MRPDEARGEFRRVRLPIPTRPRRRDGSACAHDPAETWLNSLAVYRLAQRAPGRAQARRPSSVDSRYLDRYDPRFGPSGRLSQAVVAAQFDSAIGRKRRHRHHRDDLGVGQS